MAACSIQPPFWWIVRAATPESPTGQYRNIYVQQSWANTGINSRLISLFCGIWVMLRCNKSAHLYISRQTSGIQSLTHDPDQAPDQATPAWCYKAILSVTNSSSHLIGSTSDWDYIKHDLYGNSGWWPARSKQLFVEARYRTCQKAQSALHGECNQSVRRMWTGFAGSTNNI